MIDIWKLGVLNAIMLGLIYTIGQQHILIAGDEQINKDWYFEMDLAGIPDNKILKELKRRFQCNQIKDPKNVIFIGPPAAGKGT